MRRVRTLQTMAKLAAPARAQVAEANKLAARIDDLADQRKHSDAISLARSVREVREKYLGTDHQDTIAAMKRLGQLLDAQGNFRDAQPLLRTTLGLTNKVLGENHPESGSV